ncbi:MAG: type II restriction endonuclease [Kiritimatiellae bacterium]|nr:type II restriction endonuclease [Kiritimatiellia bacterium]
MSKKDNVLIAAARRWLHAQLVSSGVLVIGSDGIPSNSDKDNKPSCEIGRFVAERLKAKKGRKLTAQKVGSIFEKLICEFVKMTFPHLQHLRPGKWTVANLGNINAVKTSSFAQYEHLAHLSDIVQKDRQLATMLGNDYVIAPDIVVSRSPCSDEEINALGTVIDNTVCLKTDIRNKNNTLEIMHASISAKWTMRSDRAQNSRTEALNLIRNRKGHLPHVVVVTGEPLPSRLASLALGTGDIDCVYHFALNELVEATEAFSKDGREDVIELLNTMINGKRLRDISDLPLDLSC